MGHVRRIKDGRLPEAVLYGKLTAMCWPTGLRYIDVSKKVMKSAMIDKDK